MGSFKNGLVITGGASGIGAATVKAALARGWPVAFCDVQPRDKIDPSLLTEKSLYVQADVTKPDQMACFRSSTIRSFAERDLTPDKLNVVACAGISRRGDPVQVQLMKDINEGGTFNLLYAFANDIPAGRGLFVGLSSIVAAEGIAVKGDEEYKSTKAEARRIATEEARGLGVEGFAVAPGAIDTPMTRHEAVFGMLLLGAARTFGGDAKHPLNKEVLSLAGIRACTTPAVVLKATPGRPRSRERTTSRSWRRPSKRTLCWPCPASCASWPTSIPREPTASATSGPKSSRGRPRYSRSSTWSSAPRSWLASCSTNSRKARLPRAGCSRPTAPTAKTGSPSS